MSVLRKGRQLLTASRLTGHDAPGSRLESQARINGYLLFFPDRLDL